MLDMPCDFRVRHYEPADYRNEGTERGQEDGEEDQGSVLEDVEVGW